MWDHLRKQLTPEEHALKSAYRLRRLGPLSYRRAVREGRLPDVAETAAARERVRQRVFTPATPQRCKAHDRYDSCPDAVLAPRRLS